MIHSSLQLQNGRCGKFCQVEDGGTSTRSIWKAISFLKRATEAGPKEPQNSAIPSVAWESGKPKEPGMKCTNRLSLYMGVYTGPIGYIAQPMCAHAHEHIHVHACIHACTEGNSSFNHRVTC